MKGKKIISFSLAAMLALGTFTVLPAVSDGAVDVAITSEAADSDFVTTKDKNGDIWITDYKGKGGDIVIPDGYMVYDEAFANNNNIKSITFNGKLAIGSYAFYNCKKLETIVFKKGVAVHNHAFSSCVNLKSVDFQNGIISGVGYQAFECCNSLESVKIGKSDDKFLIGFGAFHECYSLKSINIPEECKEIGGGAFLSCVNLEKVTVPAGAKFIYDDSAYQFGYFYGYKTEEEAMFGGDRTFVKADGKKSAYFSVYSTSTGLELEEGLFVSGKKFTPKKLTMTVTKGSDAEKYAKKYGVAYKYASDDSKKSNTTSNTSSTGKLAAPTNIKASKTTSSITLTWDKVDGADAYKVWKYNEKTGKYEKYKTVAGAKCTVSGLTKGTKYKFKVTSLDKVDGKYKSGETSKAVSVTTKK